jgi:hypothetical protein
MLFKKRYAALTLLELIISIILLGVIVIGFSSIELFSRYQVISSDRRSIVQNEAAYVLEHMTKNLSQAIGSVNYPGVLVGSLYSGATPIPLSKAIKVRLDRNNNGQADEDTDFAWTLGWIAYGYFDSPNYQLFYAKNYPYGPTYWDIPYFQGGLISARIISPTFAIATPNNYIDITVTACWDPKSTIWSCGTLDNPSTTMSTRIKMPSISTN